MENKKMLTVKNYAGYTMVDVGNSLAFSVIGSYLSRFYTNILKIGDYSSLILILARIWDGINDPMMGFLAQRKAPTKAGKYRPYLLKGGLPLAVAAFLVFVRIPGLSTFGNALWAFVTYIAYGMLYTVLLVPYGSLSSVMTYHPGERNMLSVCRSLGGGIGNIPGGLLIPMLVFVNNEIDPNRMMMYMAFVAILMAVMYTMGYFTVKENVPIPAQKQEIHIKSTLKSLVSDKVFIVMSLVGCFLIASNMYTGTVTTYLFPDYFQKAGMMPVYYICSYAPMVLMMPFINKITEKIGKKEFIIGGLTLSVVSALLLTVIKTDNIWIYCIFNFLINFGAGFLTLDIWSLAVDIIDYREYKTGVREEAVTYSSFTFMRKIGQAIAGIAPTVMLKTGYNTALTVQSSATLNKMYLFSTGGTFLLYLIMLLLMFFYPLNKQKTKEMHETLNKRRSTEAKS